MKKFILSSFLIIMLVSLANAQQTGLADEKVYGAINNAMDWDNVLTRNFVHKLLRDQKFNWYNADRKINQLCTIYSRIRDNWDYVYDPPSRDYFAKASESIQIMSGDCDDYAILMATCLYVSGFRTRVVLTEEHAYPEVYAGETYSDLIDMKNEIYKSYFWMSSTTKEFYYHKEDDGYWINLDWTSEYPGGELANDGLYNFAVYPIE